MSKWPEQTLQERLLLVVVLCVLATSSWTGAKVAGLSPCDILTVLGLALSIGVRRVGAWRFPLVLMGAAAFGAVVSSVLVALLLQRGPAAERLIDSSIQGSSTFQGSSSATLSVLRLVLATLAIPYLCYRASALREDKRNLHLCVAFWLGGIIFSSAIAIASAEFGLNLQFLFQVTNSSRVSGLAFHPNSLAVSCVVAVPFIMALGFSHSGKARVAAIVALVIVFDAVLASGSRGGLAACVLGLVLASIVVAAARFGGFIVVPVSFALTIAGLVAWELMAASTRFTNNPNARESDLIRSYGRGGAWDAFQASPIFGTGYQAIGAGTSVPYGVLAAGGLIGAFAFYVFVGGALAVTVRAAVRGPLLAAASACSMVALLFAQLFENSVVERYEYAPLAFGVLLASLSWSRDRRASHDRHSAPVAHGIAG